MNLKPLLITAACSALLVSQFALSVSLPTGGLKKIGEEWKTNFNYTNSDCKKNGYDGGMIKIGNEKYCIKVKDAQTKNLKTKSSKTWSKTSSKTDWLFCSKNSSSCSQSLNTGKNSCVSASSSVTKSSTVTSNIEGTLIKDVLKLGASKSSTNSWTTTKGTSTCASSDLRQTCTAKPKTKIRLKHNLIMQRFKGDAVVKGYKMRQKRILYRHTISGKESSKVEGGWKGYKSKSETKKGAVEGNFPVRRNAICDAQKI